MAYMALSEDIKQLSRGLVEAWDMRTAAVAGIREDTATMLSDLGRARVAMGAALRAELSKGRAHLTADVAAGRRVLLKDLAGASAAWAGFNATMAERRGVPVAKPAAKRPAQTEASQPAARAKRPAQTGATRRAGK